ncbi:DUF4832 domain-containing protein [Kineococcus sp. SYSU DK004]|uniref:DUF4832 domain-containing protein n=1 Tax=Kineococcus sp. SYSU DK004 TaxID=3383125 RepID=UPI003D7C3F72
MLRCFAAAVAVATAGALAALPLPTAAASETAPAVTQTSYTDSGSAVANPERGFYRYTDTHHRADGSGRVPLDEAQLVRWRTGAGTTLVYRVYYLEGFVDRDALPVTYLQQVAADLDTARRAGVKLVVRFAYSEDTDVDAPADRVVAHVRQLVPVLNAGADVLQAVQAGFVGRWGEWYYSRSFTSDPQRPWLLSDADWAARSKVLRALRDGLSPDVRLQVRYPQVAQRLLPGDQRTGVHNDCFLASDDDFGTFRDDTDRAWLAERSRTALVGGETCATAGTRSSLPSALTDLRRYGWTYLNRDFHLGVLESWGTQGLADVEARLGYRLALVTSSVPRSLAAGERGTVAFSLVNSGFAAPLSSRPVDLVLVDTSGRVASRTRVPLDTRTLRPGTTTPVEVAVQAPAPGEYRVALALPDAHPQLAARPEYAVQLAEDGGWDGARGLNLLSGTLSVAAPTAPLTPPAPAPAATRSVAVSSLTPTSSSNGWGPVELDRSNGERAAGDGRTLRLRGRSFSTGLGVHSSSDVTLPLPAGATRFTSTIGVDDETAGRGSVVFSVYVDGRLAHRSGTLTGTSPAQSVSVPLSGARTLRLSVRDAGDGTSHDHADWAGAVVEVPAS